MPTPQVLHLLIVYAKPPEVSTNQQRHFVSAAIPLSYSFFAVGAFMHPGGNRTRDTEIFSLLFYQLNYRSDAFNKYKTPF